MHGVLQRGHATAEGSSDSSDSDAALVALAQMDRQAFALLYRRYLNPVHQYCFRRLGSREAAEDATSLVFTKAFAALPTFRAGSFRSWLFAIAHHVIADSLRARRVVDELEAAAEVPDGALAPDEIVIVAEANTAVV